MKNRFLLMLIILIIMINIINCSYYRIVSSSVKNNELFISAYEDGKFVIYYVDLNKKSKEKLEIKGLEEIYNHTAWYINKFFNAEKENEFYGVSVTGEKNIFYKCIRNEKVLNCQKIDEAGLTLIDLD